MPSDVSHLPNAGAKPAMSQERLLWMRRLGVASIAVAFLVMVLGAWVKANGAGLACPDWPACYGKFFPPFPSAENGGMWHDKAVNFSQAQELYEWAHRAVVSLLALPLVAFAITAGTNKAANIVLRRLAWTALGLYVFQALLGQVTVVTGNPPWATTTHLATATTLLFVLTVATSIAFLHPDAPTKAAAPTTPHSHAGGPRIRRIRQANPGESTATAVVRFPGEESHGR
jgi:heme A synthase